MAAGARPTRDRQRRTVPPEAPPPRPHVATIIRLQQDFFVLWATPPGEEVAFEVSKVVDKPLQARCTTAPLCPPEAKAAREARGEDADLDDVPVNPAAPADPDCPYCFENKSECIRERNIEALRTALFSDADSTLIANYLKALGFAVRQERIPIDGLNGSRVLMAHSRIYNFHDVRVICAPGGQELVLIRNPY